MPKVFDNGMRTLVDNGADLKCQVSGEKMTSMLTPETSSETPAFGVYVGVGLRSRRAARGGVPVVCRLRRQVRDRHCHLPQAGGYTRLTLRSIRPLISDLRLPTSDL